jgi:hypothetical protein
MEKETHYMKWQMKALIVISLFNTIAIIILGLKLLIR